MGRTNAAFGSWWLIAFRAMPYSLHSINKVPRSVAGKLTEDAGPVWGLACISVVEMTWPGSEERSAPGDAVSAGDGS